MVESVVDGQRVQRLRLKIISEKEPETRVNAPFVNVRVLHPPLSLSLISLMNVPERSRDLLLGDVVSPGDVVVEVVVVH